MLLVGEAWGESEEQTRRPFVGYSGKELWLMLGEAMPDLFPQQHESATRLHKYGNAWVKEREEWLAAAGIAMTNVLALRPPGNKLDSLCVLKTDLPDKGKGYALPSLVRGKYLLPELLPELSRLHQEIEEISPNLIVALGATACWALLGATNIGSIRGAVTADSSGRKVLPTWHPQYVNYQWPARPIVVTDLMKAARESQFPEIRRPRREILIRPTVEEVEQWALQLFIHKPAFLAADIETEGGQTKCIGFGPDRRQAIVIPFFLNGFKNYWPTAELESHVWEIVRRVLESDIPKVGQNFLYDLQYILKMGIKPRAVAEDTMLLHHSLFPEMRKSLGFLGSIYTSEPAWKLMRREKSDTVKRDE